MPSDKKSRAQRKTSKQDLINWINSLPDDTPEETWRQMAAVVEKFRREYELEKD